MPFSRNNNSSSQLLRTHDFSEIQPLAAPRRPRRKLLRAPLSLAGGGGTALLHGMATAEANPREDVDS
jgi:hypothetical protein